MSTPTIDRPTVNQLRRIVGITPQKQASNSVPVPPYVRWYTGLRDRIVVHAVAKWRVSEDVGMIVALCGRPDSFWGTTARSESGEHRCPVCLDRAVDMPQNPPDAARVKRRSAVRPYSRRHYA